MSRAEISLRPISQRTNIPEFASTLCSDTEAYADALEMEHEQHGVLITTEQGAVVDEVVDRAKTALEAIATSGGGVVHEHVAKA